jgi:E3 ubiquitin-protein ligase SHPRH
MPLLNVPLSNNDIAKLLVPLLKLRQACCHPQVGSSGLCTLQRNPLSMDEILQVNNSLFYLQEKLVLCE